MVQVVGIFCVHDVIDIEKHRYIYVHVSDGTYESLHRAIRVRQSTKLFELVLTRRHAKVEESSFAKIEQRTGRVELNDPTFVHHNDLVAGHDGLTRQRHQKSRKIGDLLVVDGQ